MHRAILLLSAGLMTLFAAAASAQNDKPRNLILFVPDGLRGRIVTPQTAPAMAEIRDKGVNFTNSHSLFPTFTTANASAMATGHYLGDTGDFSNTIYTGYPVGAGGRHRHAVPRIRSGSHRCRRAFRRRLSERGNRAENGARQGLQHGSDRQARSHPDLRSYRQDRRRWPAFDRDRRFHRRQGRRAAFAGDAGRIGQGQSPARTHRRAATTPRPAMPGRRAPWCRIPRSRPISPTSPPRSCCRCSRRATSRSCWCSGRAIPTAASTTTATASTP